MHNIYLIEVNHKTRGDYITYDCYDSHVVIADSPKEARKMCPSADEGYETWLESRYSIIKKIGITNRKKQVVLSSYAA